MTRRLVIAMTGMVAVVSVVLAIPLAVVVASDQRNALIADLQVDTLTTAASLGAHVPQAWPTVVEDVAESTGARVVVVDVRGVLVADSAQRLDSAVTSGRIFDRPEILAALRGNLSSNVRASRTLGGDLRFVAAPVFRDRDVVAAVRLSVPETRVLDAVRETLVWLAVFVGALLVASTLVAVFLARSIAGPIRALAAVARALPTDLRARADETDGPIEVREAAQTLNRTAALLDGVLQRTQAVAAEASHHLRTPLTGVRLRLEAIEDLAAARAGLAPTPVDATEIIEQAVAATAEVDRLTHRIDQVLALARSDARVVSGRGPLVDRASVARIVDARVSAARAGLADRGVTITLTGCGDGGSTNAPADRDVGELPRIVDELLANAGGYARSEVLVSVDSDPATPGVVLIAVGDDGVGVPPAEWDRIFDRFARGSGAIPGGSGLGLALVREAARRAGGDAVASSDPRLGGLRVVVIWPIIQEESSGEHASG